MNHIWIIEKKFFGKSWFPLSEVYYTRAEARVARQDKIARMPVARKYRVVPYVPRVNHCKKSMW